MYLQRKILYVCQWCGVLQDNVSQPLYISDPIHSTKFFDDLIFYKQKKKRVKNIILLNLISF